MTLESRDPKRQVETTAVYQQFNHREMIRSHFGTLDRERSLCEVTDNGIDDNNDAIIFTFNPYPNTTETAGLTIEYFNGNGMNIDVMNNFLRWGNEQAETGKIKQWGWGGKLALLHWLDEKDGTLRITSSPAKGAQMYSMRVENWWRILRETDKIEVTTENSSNNGKGHTTFELLNLNKELIPSLREVEALANQMGLIYGKIIEQNKLKLLLRRFGNRGRSIEDFNVQAIVPTFLQDHDYDEKQVTIKTDRGPVKLELTWGHLNIEQRNHRTKERAAIYRHTDDKNPNDLHELENITGGVYIYNYGRLLGIVPLSKLGLPRTSLASFQSFAVTADIVGGWAQQDLLKTQLSSSARSTKQIFDRISLELQSTIREIAKRSDSSVSEKEKRYIKELEAKFQKTLLKMFLNKNKIGEVLNQVMSTSYSEQSKNTNKDQGKGTGLPGIRSSRGSNSSDKNVYKPEGEKQAVVQNPIPQFEIRPDLADIYPPAEISVNESGESIIIFNRKHPAVGKATESKNPNSAMLLTMLAAECFFHQKWVRDAQGDPEIYALGMHEDVANFLKAFEAI